LHNPDYVKFAESFGAIGIRLGSPEEIGDRLKEALNADRPVVIECPVPQLDTRGTPSLRVATELKDQPAFETG
jgi:thiamine pyrophosphate-dependent acetolactate synthase large subunit-like protein